MRKAFTLLAGFLLVTMANGQSLAGLNSELPEWVRFSGEYRTRYEGFLGRTYQPGNDDQYLLSRFRLGMRLQPSRWFKVFAQAQDSRVFWNSRIPDAPPYQDSLDLRLAWAEFGDSDKGPVGLRVGRQEINLGEERLLGSSNWGNTARSFDAVRLTGNLHKVRVDLFAASVVGQVTDAFDHHVQGDNLHGAMGAAELGKTKLEPFLLWRLSPRVRAESGSFGKLNSRTFGVRWSGAINKATEFVTEMAGQTGDWGTDKALAWAGHWRILRTLSSDRRVPKLRMEYDYAQGDSNPRDGRHETFELLYPTPHDKLGLADQVGWKNIHHISAVAEWKPLKTLTLQTKYHNWWLASETDGVYNAGGTLIARDMTGHSGRHVGQEVDFQLLTSAGNQILLGAGLGHIFPGDFLHKTTPGSTYTFPYAMLTWAF